MIATRASSAFFSVGSMAPESDAKSAIGIGFMPKETYTRGLRLKANIQLPLRANGTKILVDDYKDIRFDEKQMARFGSGTFLPNSHIHRQYFPIRSYEIGPNGTVTLETLMSLLQVRMAQRMEFVPGPINPEVLYEQKDHISNDIWETDSEVKLTSHNHDHYPEITDWRVLDYVEEAGFYGLYKLGFCKVNVGLITALVERWRPECSTFHFPVGESTVTLQDVEILGGVRVTGMPVIRSEKGETIDTRVQLFEELLGVRPPRECFNDAGCINVRWLIQNFDEDELTDDTPDEVIQFHARAAILRILGSSFIQDTQGSHLPLFVLPFLRDFQTCGLYSWGSAILAVLYRSLFKASILRQKGMNGPLSILQIWAWTRFQQVRPCDALPAEKMPPNGRPRNPYGTRWVESQKRFGAGGYGFSLRVYRDEFDKMQPSQVCWEPYKDIWDSLPDCYKEGENIWRAEVPLIFIDKVEKHKPGRVKRQFGLKQDVSLPNSGEEYSLHRLSRVGHPKHNWPREYRTHLRVWESFGDHIIVGEPHDGRNTMTDDYMPWYHTITRRWIGPLMTNPPERGSQRTAGLVDMMFRALVENYRMFSEIGHADGMTTCKQVFAIAGVDVADLGSGGPSTFSQRQRVPNQQRRDVPSEDQRRHDVPSEGPSRLRRSGSRRHRQQTSSDMDIETPPPTPTPTPRPTPMPTVQPVPYGGWYPPPPGYFTPYPPPPPPFGTYPHFPQVGAYPPPQPQQYPGQSSTSHQPPSSGNFGDIGMDFMNQLFETPYYPHMGTSGGSTSQRPPRHQPYGLVDEDDSDE